MTLKHASHTALSALSGYGALTGGVWSQNWVGVRGH